MVDPTEEASRPKRVNFRHELLRYQSLRGHDLYGSEEELENKGQNIWRNFISQCSATFLAVFAVIPSRNLQTSIHMAHDLGKVSLCCMYASYIVGCFFSTLILQRFRAKCMLLSSLFFHILYSVSNVIPSAFTLLPASCLVGLCQPAFWSIQDCLLLGYGLKYSAMASLPPQSALRLFQTVTIITIHSAQILGNLLSSGLISASDFHCEEELDSAHHRHYMQGHNGTAAHRQNHGGKVLHNEKWTYTLPFIPIQTRRLTETSPSVNFYQLLTLIYLCMSVIAMGSVLIFFESPDVALQRRTLGWREKLRGVRKCLTDPRWLLLWFAACYIGFAQGMIICDISKGYGSDVFGCYIVGYMMVSFGTGNLLAILVLEKIKACGIHPLLLTAGFLLNIAMLILTSLWRPTESQSWQLLVFTAMWGVGDGTLQSQAQSVVVKYAREERDVAMTTFRVSQGLGLLVSFIVSIFTRSLVTSLYVALPLHVLGFLGLILTSNELTSRQRSQHRDNARQHSPTTSDSREHSDYHNIGGDA